MPLGTDYLIRYLADTKDAIAGAKALETLNKEIAKTIGADYANMTRVVGTTFGKITGYKVNVNGKEAIKTIQDFTTTTTNAAGSFYQLQGSIVKVGDMTNVMLKPALKDVTGQFVETSISAEKAKESFKSIISKTIELGTRALLVVPIWMALRSAMTGTISAFKDSISAIIMTDTELQKVKRSLQGTTEEITTQFETLKTASEALAIASGISDEKIIASFQKFIQAGFGFETAMAGAQLSTKLAITTFSDGVSIANSLTGAFRVLLDTTGKSGSEVDQMNAVYAQLNELSKTNKISMNEFGDSLVKMAPVAKSNNITLHDTVALLATLENAGLKGTTAGQLLRTSLEKLLANLDKLAPSLGVHVNPALDNTTSVLLKVIDAVEKLSSTSNKVSPDLKAALNDIFGGARSSQAITALIALREGLEKNLSITGKVADLNSEFAKTSNILGNQINRYHVLNSEMGKAFLTGLVGTNDFNSAMKELNDTYEKLLANAQNFGSILRNTVNLPAGVQNVLNAIPLKLQAKLDPGFATKIQDQVTQALHGQASKLDLGLLFNTLLEAQTNKIDIGLSDKEINAAISSIRGQFLTLKPQMADVGILANVIAANLGKTTDVAKKDNDLILKKTDFLKLEGFLRKELSATGLSEVDVEQKILDFRQASGEFLTKDIELQKELINHLRAVEEIELRRNRARGLIDNQLELLRLQGATSLQVVQQRIELEKMFGLNQTRADLLKNELELNREITKEKENQNKVSSDSLKLFEVAQKFGIQTSTRVAEFLKNPNVTSLTNGGANTDLLPILKEFFSAQLQQFQAQEFFFKGLGANIPIPERTAIQNVKPIDLASIKIPAINTQVGQINIDIKKLFKEEDTAKQIIDAMLEAIRNNQGIEDAINEKIDNF